MRTIVLSFAVSWCVLVAGPSLSWAQDAPDLTMDELVSIAVTRTLPTTLTRDQHATLASVIGAFRRSDSVTALQQWTTFCTNFVTTEEQAAHATAIVRYVLRAAFLEPNRRLNERVQRVAFHRAQADAVRAHLVALRARRAEATRRSQPQTTIPVLVLTSTFRLDAAATSSAGSTVMTIVEIDQAVLDWQARLAEAEDAVDSEVMQTQEVVEEESSACETMSSMKAAMHSIELNAEQNLHA